MPRYRMKWRHARWETSTFYTDADNEEAARAKFDTGDIEKTFDCEPGGYVDFVEPETIIEPVGAPIEADAWPIAFPATIAARLHAAMRGRPCERISVEEWIAVAREIGSVMIERFEGPHGERLCKLTFDDGSDIELVEPINTRSWVNLRISW
jgi:hypothetical protein